MELSVIALADRIETEADAYAFLEELRWGDKPVCPHCDSERVFYLKPANGMSRATRTGSISQRRVWKCGACRKQFTVLVGTIFHGTKISLRKWLFVVLEMCSAKNGISAREIERRYKLTPKTAWFMTHRIREAMKREPLAGMLSHKVTADETWIGGLERNRKKKDRNPGITPAAEPTLVTPGQREKKHGGPTRNKVSVLSLVDRETGEVRSQVVPDVTGATLRKAISEHVDMPATTLHTDEGMGYKTFAKEFAAHETVNHSDDEYVRYTDDGFVSTNHAEGYFSQLKRSIDGTHHHVSREHLQRYLAEFDYRWTTRKLSDTARTQKLMGQVAGRRLTYRPLTGR